MSADTSPRVLVTTPQISWHGREPVLSVDVSSSSGLVATGGSDGEVRLWRVGKPGAGEVLTFVQDLSGHTKVRAVRDRTRQSLSELSRP